MSFLRKANNGIVEKHNVFTQILPDFHMECLCKEKADQNKKSKATLIINLFKYLDKVAFANKHQYNTL